MNGEQQPSAWDPEPVRRLPLTRAGCADLPRPCPHVSCRYHLYLDVKANGRIKLTFPELEQPQADGSEARGVAGMLGPSCALDAAEAGPLTLEQVGTALNLTRERCRQLEELILAKLSKSRLLRELAGK